VPSQAKQSYLAEECPSTTTLFPESGDENFLIKPAILCMAGFRE
jgi:hypothetical protein